MNDFLSKIGPQAEWSLRSGKALMVKLKTLPELEAFWQEHRRLLPYAVTACNIQPGQDLLNPFEWVFGVRPEDVVKAVTRWEQCGVRAEWRPWSEDSMQNAEMAAITPARVSHRGWWVLLNYPDAEDEFCWEGPGSGMILDPSVGAEHMEHQFQLELFESWRGNEQNMAAFTASEFEAYISAWRDDRNNGLDYYGRQNEQIGQPVCM